MRYSQTPSYETHDFPYAPRRAAPRFEAESQPPGDDAPSPADSYEAASGRSRRSVLIVDDDQDLLESMRDLLEIDESVEVATATDITSAVDATFRRRPRVALIDIKLDAENGLDLVPLLKKAHPGLVCIVMTAYRDAANSRRAFESGADVFLYKPLDPTALIQRLEEIFAGD